MVNFRRFLPVAPLLNCLFSTHPPTHPPTSSNTFWIQHLDVESLSFVYYIHAFETWYQKYMQEASQTIKEDCILGGNRGGGCRVRVMLALLFVLWKLWGTFWARQTCPPLVASSRCWGGEQKEKCTTDCQDTRTPTITITPGFTVEIVQKNVQKFETKNFSVTNIWRISDRVFYNG